MTTLFTKARDWLPGKIKAAAGRTVTLTREATTVSLTATAGRTVFASNQIDGARIEFGDRDFLIVAADLPGSIGEPAIGDRISETLAGSARVFEITTPGTGEPAVRWSDTDHTVYRVHCKRVS